jgi:hypothetical protein
MSAEEFDFFARHRGGFDRQFFSDHLPALLAGYCLRDGIQPTEVEVLVRVESGEGFAIRHADAALTWVELHTASDPSEARIVPMGAVREVRFRRRPGPPAAVGFSAAIVDESPPSLTEGRV